MLTFLVLLIFLTSFFLNYSHTTVPAAWFPKQMVLELSGSLRKLLRPRPCTCALCVSQQGLSAWFDQRFNQTPPPLLNAHNALLEEDTYQWWLVSPAVDTGRGRGLQGHTPALRAPVTCASEQVQGTRLRGLL